MFRKDNMNSIYTVHKYTVKKVTDFPVPSRDVTNQTLSGREKLKYFRPVRVWLVTSRLGTGKSPTFFYSARDFFKEQVARNMRPNY
jgi:hypothetical protein